MPPVAPGIATLGRHGVGIGWVEGDDPLLAKDPGRHRAFVIHFDRIQAVCGKAPGRDGSERADGILIDHDRCPARTHHRAHLPHDDLCRLLQPDGASQDFADGIEEIDFLVAAGQFLRHVGPLPLRLEKRAHYRD